MKRKLLLSFFATLVCLAASAYDFEVGGIYYNFLSGSTVEVTYSSSSGGSYRGAVSITPKVIYNRKTYAVTAIGEYAFANSGGLRSVTIPNSVTTIGGCAFEYCTGLTSVTIPKSVTTIGFNAFSGCESLIIVTIPNSVTTIDEGAFRDCTGLTSVTIPKSVTTIGNSVFYGCTGLTSVTIPNSVTTIGNSVFYGCTGLTSVTIPKSVTTIGNSAFWSCTSLTSVTIPNSVTAIDNYAFKDCSSLTSVTIPNSVTTIGEGAFENCRSLKGVTLPDNIKEIGIGPFSYEGKQGKDHQSYYYQECKLYANKGTYTLMALWCANPYWEKKIGTYYPYDVYDAAHPSELIKRPTVSAVVSPTAIRGEIKDLDGNYTYGLDITDKYYFKYGSTENVNDDYYHYTDPIHNTFVVELDSLFMLYHNREIDLSSQNKNEIEYYVYICKGDVKLQFAGLGKIPDVIIQTQQPKVVKEGNVIVSAKTNLDESVTSVGFEWRRTDWTDDFASNTSKAYIYDGTMEGYIRNMNTNHLWKYRPYYEGYKGTKYYGEWVGLDPSNTSYFEPTVHTYADISVNGSSAKVKGYVQRGTDNISSQGFAYWKTGGASAKAYAPTSIPANATKVEAKGTVMETTLSGLDYNSTYAYVAYVTTSEGETLYGDQRTFTTGVNPTGIVEVAADTPKAKYAAGIYDMNGRKIEKTQRGINIIRFADGTVKKVLVK